MENSKSTDFWQDLISGRFASMVKETAKGQPVSNSRDVYNIMKPMFVENDDVEACYCIFLNAKNMILSIDKMFSGSICSSAIYPREILKSLFRHKASSMVMVHNHPSGDPTPSAEDKAITVKVGFAMASIDAYFHDHLIIGNGFFSMADSGWLQRISRQFKDVVQADCLRDGHGQN